MPEEKLLNNEDFLILKNAELELRFIDSQRRIIFLETQALIQEMAYKYETIGWQLDLPNRKWIKLEVEASG